MVEYNMAEPTFETKLDVTQPIHISDAQFYEAGLTSDEIATLRSLPTTQLSSLIPYVLATGSKRKAQRVAEKLELSAELNESGNRRCIYKDSNGNRCDKYGDANVPVCKKHSKAVTMMGSFFKSKRLQDVYAAFANSPEKMSCDNELALMRTMLATLLTKLDHDSVNLELIGAVTAMSDKITGVVERMNKMNAITPEQLQILMAKMVEVAGKYVPVDKLESFAKDIEAIEITNQSGRAAMPRRLHYTPGEEVDMPDGTTRTIEGITVKRALVETAERMGVTVDKE